VSGLILWAPVITKPLKFRKVRKSLTVEHSEIYDKTSRAGRARTDDDGIMSVSNYGSTRVPMCPEFNKQG
jgi:hypothetical protein